MTSHIMWHPASIDVRVLLPGVESDSRNRNWGQVSECIFSTACWIMSLLAHRWFCWWVFQSGCLSGEFGSCGGSCGCGSYIDRRNPASHGALCQFNLPRCILRRRMCIWTIGFSKGRKEPSHLCLAVGSSRGGGGGGGGGGAPEARWESQVGDPLVHFSAVVNP